MLRVVAEVFWYPVERNGHQGASGRDLFDCDQIGSSHAWLVMQTLEDKDNSWSAIVSLEVEKFDNTEESTVKIVSY